ncbi:hypothetical protein [Streptomyces sp. 8L]|uniref:hypothetical protein n=1 Tax=Streptomyces sp. 8L TaxID=2877242 RepID=UPI001CD4132E|nr:hypothetical protein [Streptomyces sp. 8L]MCA1223469.1 hypothetical protein [Streptomyces sp. 8L]
MTTMNHDSIPITATAQPMAKPDLKSLPRWAGWSAAGRLKLHLALYYRCHDCRTDIHAIAEYYRVHDHIRTQAHMCEHSQLCIGCLETRLDRRLTPFDCTNVPLNRAETWSLPGHQHVRIQRSQRLQDRLRGR